MSMSTFPTVVGDPHAVVPLLQRRFTDALQAGASFQDFEHSRDHRWKFGPTPPRHHPKAGASLYVAGLPETTTEDEIRQFVAPVAENVRVTMLECAGRRFHLVLTPAARKTP